MKEEFSAQNLSFSSIEADSGQNVRLRNTDHSYRLFFMI